MHGGKGESLQPVAAADDDSNDRNLAHMNNTIILQELRVSGRLLGGPITRGYPIGSYRLADLVNGLLFGRNIEGGIIEFYSDRERTGMLSTLLQVSSIPIGRNIAHPIYFSVTGGKYTSHKCKIISAN